MIYREIWEALENPVGHTPFGYLRRRIQAEARCDLFLAVAHPSRQRLFQIGIWGINSMAVDKLTMMRGLDIAVLPGNMTEAPIIQLSLREERFAALFDILIQDIAKVAGQKDSEAAAAACINRLRHWQRFLEQADPGGLSREAQQGLYGELWVLREKVLPLLGRYTAVSAWTGPTGTNQDFQFPGCALEVKTTGMQEPQQMIIQSERQLDDTGLAVLLLYHLSLEAREQTGETLVEMVDSLRRQLALEETALNLFEDRLLDAGFLQSQSQQYKKIGYNIKAQALFRVNDAFPRIVGTDLKPGVGNIRYTIAVAECRHFSVNEHELQIQLVGTQHE